MPLLLEERWKEKSVPGVFAVLRTRVGLQSGWPLAGDSLARLEAHRWLFGQEEGDKGDEWRLLPSAAFTGRSPAALAHG